LKHLPTVEEATSGEAAPSTVVSTHRWCCKLREAAQQALTSRLPPQHIAQVILALVVMTQVAGVTALLHLPSANGKGQDGRQATELVTVVTQVSKVQLFSHLQGCSLELQDGRAAPPLPEYLLSSKGSFTACVQMMLQLLRLAEKVEEQLDGAPSETDAAQVKQAVEEGNIVQVCFIVLHGFCNFNVNCLSHLVLGAQNEQQKRLCR
jgi:hypothetical protein